MTNFTTYTIESAPDTSKPTLQAINQKLGFVPNLMANMAESPVMVESYLTLMTLYDKSSLTAAEREIILMTNNRLNGCTYCMAAHTAVAKMAGVDDKVITALRDGSTINDTKLEALRQFTIVIHETHGHPTQTHLDAFLAAGYTRKNILEVVVGTSLKVLSNYTTPLVKPALDQAFTRFAWKANNQA